MGTERTSIALARTVDLRVLDGVLAVLLTAGALADASSQLHRGPHELAIAPLVLLTGSVAWRRLNPWLTTVAAVTGFMAFQLASGYTGGGAFEVAAIALNFYLLGRRTRGRERMLSSAVVFAYWLAGVVVITYSQPGGSIGAVLGSWTLVGGLPFAVGRTLETRRALTLELQASTARLADAQEGRAGRAAAEERHRMARELHDVIAHDVSVMVLQSSGARGVASVDSDRAREAMRVVENAGRDALVELRRIVGALYRSGEAPGLAAPGLSQLDALVDRARAAGLPVDMHVNGRMEALSPGLDLVAYRVLQEALTNAIKHAGPARARVIVTVAAGCLELEVSDNGHGPTPARDNNREPGHGLVGMNERVRLYGGELYAGRLPDTHGFEVRAQIPLDGIGPSPQPVTPRADAGRLPVSPERGLRWRWLDPACAGALLVALEIGELTAQHRNGPLALNMLVVAAVALAAVGRRSSPVWFLVVVAVLAAVMNALLTPLDHSPLLAAYFLLVPAYTVAAWLNLRQAVLTLAFLLGCSAISGLIAEHHQSLGNLAGAAFTISAAWAAGRAIRARRAMSSELQRTSTRLVAEHEDRAQLAVAGERSRIASELHTIVARSVVGMVVQAEGARSMLASDPERADVAMGAIEDAGRQTLAEMRRLLGVLRHGDDRAAREPQPGVAQVYSLIQRARERGQSVELRVDGEPGTLAAAVDLGLYRILEDALDSARRHRVPGVAVTLRFREEDLELRVAARCHGPNAWPTDAMRERIALCDGALEDEPLNEDGWQLVARMPRGLQEALA